MLALRRRAAFGTTVGVTLGLHGAAALGLAALMGSPPAADFRTGSRPAMEVRWVTALPERVAAAAALPAPGGAITPGLPAPAAAGPADTPAAPRPPEFLGSDQVDEPARPAQAWALDAEGLATLGIQRIVFDTWVDAQASIAGLRVVELQPASAASLLPLVEARLAGTPMIAARKAGQPVAHQQRIELSLHLPAGQPG
jgi:hypothetical protein